MENDFCQALIENDRLTLCSIVNAKLDSLNMANDPNQNMAILKTWMEEFECVSEVALNPDLLDTEPPVQEFNITLLTIEGNQINRSIGIRIAEEKLRFDFKEM